jgi:8-oxo-dGTP pyrophosphatase MutT (NUDIX family)
MSRDSLLDELEIYRQTWAQGAVNYPTFSASEELVTLGTIRDFVTANSDAFERSHISGHVTGSALVVDNQLSRCLLTHHAKLDKWLQLGGHADGDTDVARVAMREAREESGLSPLDFFPYERHCLKLSHHPLMVDVDVHEIPARKTEAAHTHYDVRYLICTPEPEKIVVSSESIALKWFTLEQAVTQISERSLRRFLLKTLALKKGLQIES